MLSFEDNKNKFWEFLALRAIVTWGHLSSTKHKSVSKFQTKKFQNLFLLSSRENINVKRYMSE